MSISCDPNSLAQAAKCFKCESINTLLEIQTYLLCQIANNGTGGGGTSVLTNNHIFVGNAANVATDVPMSGDATIVNTGAVTLTNSASTRSNLGLGTTDMPQFAALGIGTPAVVPGVLNPSIKVLSPVNTPGASAALLTMDCVGGNPYMVIGQQANDNGAFIQYDRVNNKLIYSIWGAASVFSVDNGGNASGTQINAGTFFSAGGVPGITQTFNTGVGDTQITFVGGIATAIA